MVKPQSNPSNVNNIELIQKILLAIGEQPQPKEYSNKKNKEKDNQDDIDNFDVEGEKLSIHSHPKYLKMKEHFENKGWCKINEPAMYSQVKLNKEINNIEFVNSETAKDYFMNKNFITRLDNGKEIKNNFYDIWVKDPDIKTYNKIVFDPTDKLDKNINLFNGYCEFKDNFKKVKLDRVFEHMKSLCDYDKSAFEYLLNYCAQIIQYPEKRPDAGIVMFGSEGIGKNIFTQLLGNIIGSRYYLETSGEDEVFGRFNKTLLNKIILVIDECEQDLLSKKFDPQLKRIITSHELSLEEKNEKRFKVKNLLRTFILSNSLKPIKVNKSSRRYAMFRGSDKYLFQGNKQQSSKHFKELVEHFYDKNVQYSFYKYLSELDISKFKPTVVPKTAGFKQAMTIPVMIRFFASECTENKESIKYQANAILDKLIRYCIDNNFEHKYYNATTVGDTLSEYIRAGFMTKNRESSGIFYMFDTLLFKEYIKRCKYNLDLNDDEEEETDIITELDTLRDARKRLDDIQKQEKELRNIILKSEDKIWNYKTFEMVENELYKNLGRLFPIIKTNNKKTIQVSGEEPEDSDSKFLIDFN